jgi:hypothetical protein
MNIGGRQLKIKCTSVIMIYLIAISATQLSSIILSNGPVVYAYSANSQSQSLDNECGNVDLPGPNCAFQQVKVQLER